MKYVIKSTHQHTIKGKQFTDVSYFERREFGVNHMVCHPKNAKQYDTKKEADKARLMYCGCRPSATTERYEPSQQPA